MEASNTLLNHNRILIILSNVYVIVLNNPTKYNIISSLGQGANASVMLVERISEDSESLDNA